jgi:hypothetical protein
MRRSPGVEVLRENMIQMKRQDLEREGSPRRQSIARRAVRYRLVIGAHHWRHRAYTECCGRLYGCHFISAHTIELEVGKLSRHYSA